MKFLEGNPAHAKEVEQWHSFLDRANRRKPEMQEYLEISKTVLSKAEFNQLKLELKNTHKLPRFL